MPYIEYTTNKYELYITPYNTKQMNQFKTTILTVALFLLVFVMNAQPTFIKSDKYVDEHGDLLTDDFTVKNEIDNENELVKKSYFDKEGRLVFQRNYDFEGRLMYDTEGVAIYEFQHDLNNNVTEERYFDEEKYYYQPNGVGAAMIKRQFDTEGRMIKVAFFADEERMIEFGTAFIKYEYTAAGTAFEHHYDENAVLIDFCAPIILLEFDEENRIVKRTFMNPSKEMCGRFMDGDEDEVAVIEYEYYGDEITQKAYSITAKLIGTITQTFLKI